MVKIKFTVLLLLLFALSCSRYPDGVEQALRLSGDNRAELEQVLQHYRENKAESLKYQAACFLIENMPLHYCIRENVELFDLMDSLNRSDLSNKEIYACYDSIKKRTHVSPPVVLRDLETLSSGFLIQHIDRSFANWESAPWKDGVKFEDFCEYILPYAVGNRKREPWIDYYREKYLPHIIGYLQESGSSAIDLVDLVDSLNTYLIATQPLSIDFRQLSNWPPLMADHIRSGYCDDYVARTLYLLRSLGIPAGTDYTPMWNNYITPHSWNSLSAGDGKHYPFLGFESGVKDWTAFEHAPKVFRITYGIQKESLRAQHPQEPLPGFLGQPNIKDVTAEYFNVFDVTIKINNPENIRSKVVCLYVFNNQAWIPVHGGRIKRHTVTFTDMRGDMVYLPAFYTEKGLVTANVPFLLDTTGRVIPLIPDTVKKERLSLERKYHTLKRYYHDRMLHGRFQGANKADFSDGEDLYRVDEQYRRLTRNTVDLETNKAFRYIRYIGAADSHCNVAELDFYTKDDRLFHKLSGQVIGSKGSWNNEAVMSKKAAFDGNPLTFFDFPEDGAWAGLDLGRRERIDRIRFLPRNDDNNIRPGDQYELFYRDQRGWQSLGRKTGDESLILIYDDCPSGALFLLHNHTRGQEERIFTYENEKQIWW
jgi:hypothetical protein